MTTSHSADTQKPLSGVRVLELGQLLAGPFAGSVLGYFGADVIKVEPPGKGDPLRGWRQLDEQGTSYWWRSLARNKRSVTLNLRSEKGREIVRELMLRSDVVIENFKPGTLEKWGLDPQSMKADKPDLIYARISGYGQKGPYSHLPGFASVCEGMGGLRYVNGFPGERPVRPNLSIGDTLAGLHAVIGVLMSLLARGRCGGQVVDVAILDSVFNLMEGVVPEYSGAGVVRQPSGSTVTGIVPTNTYRCADGKFVVIGGNGDSIFQRLMRSALRPDLADDPRLADNAGRVRHEAEIDEVLSEWCASMTSESLLAQLAEASVPAGPIYNVADMFADEHFQARGLFEEVSLPDDGKLTVPALPPFLSATPGGTEWAGPELGQHNEEILGRWLDHSADTLADWRAQGVI
jgi:crotonobetainyl-CoA:carnitine CoA-transferase CaiB-like acyl-CoA transferase